METVDRHTLQCGAKLPCKGRKGTQAAGKKRGTAAQFWAAMAKQFAPAHGQGRHEHSGPVAGAESPALRKWLNTLCCGRVPRRKKDRGREMGNCSLRESASARSSQRKWRVANEPAERQACGAMQDKADNNTNVQARPFGLAPRVGTLCGNASRCASQSVVIAAHV
ncbi:hypothetical protein ERJ75_001219400 [Trypanosoma vivax]|nr:hypothetical protein ERJ75_001219400 [Trypanosoma vivax]